MATSSRFLGLASLFASGLSGALVAGVLSGTPVPVAYAATPPAPDDGKDVRVINTSPIPVSGTVTVGNLPLVGGGVPVIVGNLPTSGGRLLVQQPGATYGYGQQSLVSTRTVDIPAGVVLTDLILRHVFGDSPCQIYLKEIVPFGDSTAFVAIDSLYPAADAPAELHLRSGIPSDGDVGIFVNGNCTIHTMWTGYVP